MSMDAEQYAALSSIQLTWAPTPDDVWRTNELHVDGMNENSLSSVMRSFDEAHTRSTSKPLGVVIQGAAGSGKSNSIAWTVHKLVGLEVGGGLLPGSVGHEWAPVIVVYRAAIFAPARYSGATMRVRT